MNQSSVYRRDFRDPRDFQKIWDLILNDSFKIGFDRKDDFSGRCQNNTMKRNSIACFNRNNDSKKQNNLQSSSNFAIPTCHNIKKPMTSCQQSNGRAPAGISSNTNKNVSQLTRNINDLLK